MPIYINGVEIQGNVFMSSSGSVNIGSYIHSSRSSNGGGMTIIRGNTTKKEWFKGDGEVSFINCTINGHKINASYTAKNINEKIKSDYKEQGHDSKTAHLHNLYTDTLNLPACSSSKDIYTSGNNTQRVKEINGAVNVMTNGSGDIISKGDIISQNLMTNGSGDVKSKGNILAYNIITNGSGDISAYSIKALNVKVNGSGDISIDNDIKTKNLQINGSGTISSDHIEIANGEMNAKGSGIVDTESLKVDCSSIYNLSKIKSETSEITNSIIKLVGTFETNHHIKFESCDFDIAVQDNNMTVMGEGNFYSDGNITLIS